MTTRFAAHTDTRDTRGAPATGHDHGGERRA